MPTLHISSATARVALDLLKSLAILSDTTVRRSTVDREGLKPYWKSEKRPYLPKIVDVIKRLHYKVFLL